LKILLTGSEGQIGTELRLLCEALPDVSLLATDLPELDITDQRQVAHSMADFVPDVVINAAAYTAVDAAEHDRDAAFAVNETGPRILAEASERAGKHLIQISTDFVFDGMQPEPYTEDAKPNPLNVYGASKLAGERAVQAASSRHLILRTAWVFSPWGNNFMKTMLRLMDAGTPLKVVNDQFGCPTAAADIAAALLSIASRLTDRSSPACGIYHFCGKGSTSWHGFASAICDARAAATGSDVTIEPTDTDGYPTAARRPRQSALNCDRVQQIFGLSTVDWQAATEREVARYLKMNAKEQPA
jgi:dTDP-4-dehydrorhamnose reductase